MDALLSLFVLTCFVSLLTALAILFGGVIAVAIYQQAQVKSQSIQKKHSSDDDWGSLNKTKFYYQPKEYIEISRN